MTTKSSHPQTILCLGNALIDIFLSIHDANTQCRVDEKTGELCVAYGRKIQLDTYQMLVGGNAANVSIGLSRQGYRVSLTAEIGDDEFAQKILTTLKSEDITTSLMTKTKHAASSFAVGINFKGERTLFIEHVARKHTLLFPQKRVSLLYLTSLGKEWISAYKNAWQWAETHHVEIAFNPGTPQLHALSSGSSEEKQLIRTIISGTQILFVNKEEAEIIAKSLKKTGETTKDLLQVLHEAGAQIVVITDGKNGSYAIDPEGVRYHLGVFPNKPIERTGAGDSFASGFLGAYLKKKSVSEAMQWGAVNAASVVEHVGAQDGLLSQRNIRDRLSRKKMFDVTVIDK